MNGFLPANIGTFASLLMYMALIRGATFPGILGAMTVQKIFYTAIGVFVYLYLFISVPGTFNLQLGVVDDHRLLIPLLIVAAVVATYLLIRHFWERIKGLWEKAKQGGAILARPRDYVVKVLLPSFGSWVAKLIVIAIFLAAYSIPVTFHTVMSVVGGNSLANTVSFTPGGVGITQAVNSVSLSSVTTTANATAYSLGQQLIVTAWNVVFGTCSRSGSSAGRVESSSSGRRTPEPRRRRQSSPPPTRRARRRRRPPSRKRSRPSTMESPERSRGTPRPTRCRTLFLCACQGLRSTVTNRRRRAFRRSVRPETECRLRRRAGSCPRRFPSSPSGAMRRALHRCRRGSTR